MIESIPFKPGHLDLLRVSRVHFGDPNLIHDYDEGNAGMTYGETIVDTDTLTVLGVMNGIVHHDKHLEVCMIVGEAAAKQPVGFFKHVKKILELYIEKLELKRVQATIRCGFPHLIKWIEMLGFQYEGTMRQFGIDGDDYMIYSRVQ